MADTKERIDKILNDNKIVLFMKGSPSFPQCGFSARATAILQDIGVDFFSVNVLEDDEIREGIPLLAENEGIFAETAGGVTVGVARKLIASGKIPANDSAVLCITGNGLKTLDAVAGHVGKTREIKPSLREFEAMLASEEKVSA